MELVTSESADEFIGQHGDPVWITEKEDGRTEVRFQFCLHSGILKFDILKLFSDSWDGVACCHRGNFTINLRLPKELVVDRLKVGSVIVQTGT